MKGTIRSKDGTVETYEVGKYLIQAGEDQFME